MVVTNPLMRALENEGPSRSSGSPSAGSLENGKRLPSVGPNFQAYSRLGTALGRNAVHSAVREVVLAAYASLEASTPDQRFVYGETGWPRGGRFYPHRTHQNGLSVDFMVPLRNVKGEAVLFPTAPWTRFGYDLEFGPDGTRGDLRIDFESIAQHLRALDREARVRGLRIDRVILTPEYQPLLFATPSGAALKGAMSFMLGQAWVRHDEHYHVDFRIAAG